jgi:hypothetical protein
MSSRVQVLDAQGASAKKMTIAASSVDFELIANGRCTQMGLRGVV